MIEFFMQMKSIAVFGVHNRTQTLR
jgi:hypothetical protein